MNHENNHIPHFDDPNREREWLLQEDAMRRERLHLDPAGDDFRSQRYRLLVRELKSAPAGTPPEEFAQQVSALAATQSRGQAPAMALERVLTFTLACVLLLAAGTVTVIYGATWWPSFEALRPGLATAQWILALAGCLGLSWLLGTWSGAERPAFWPSK